MSYFKTKMHQIWFWLGLRLRPHWGAYSAYSPTWWWGSSLPTSQRPNPLRTSALEQLLLIRSSLSPIISGSANGYEHERDFIRGTPVPQIPDCRAAALPLDPAGGVSSPDPLASLQESLPPNSGSLEPPLPVSEQRTYPPCGLATDFPALWVSNGLNNPGGEEWTRLPCGWAMDSIAL